MRGISVQVPLSPSVALGNPGTSVLNWTVRVFLFMCVGAIICPVPLWGRKAYFASQTQRYFSPSLEERQSGAGFVVGA